MALKAVETLDQIIDVSEVLLKLLDTSNIEDENAKLALNNPADETPPETVNLLNLIAQREKSIYHLFESFTAEELQLHALKLQFLASLDTQLVNKVNSSQRSAKSEILKLKKNRKAINLYQKL
ncbi:hypothetical protein [Colwellia sp. Arc7-D]|uniref:hypothetical protein n=1 Tax=Colwellia sp. Arc7-D TaxID=2161872 RepID=UPI000D3612F7|nr:hypothetical protein [Colwellia sp. Arc7-D]AWB56712.1 hypothetical protein DBO93_03460 [Colwellia sp. Arc7-D]|tara:strand:+ start:2199 stop:2567 length:369 start_codon:yes stop_codon:yes gene_type:complete